MSFTELNIGVLAADPDHINVAERFNKTVSYFIDGTAHPVTYVDEATAIIKFNEFVALKNIPPPIVVGDTVRIRSFVARRSSENTDYTVQNVPNAGFPWWALLGNKTGTTYIIETSSMLWLELSP
jgi:hypothetical protein